jgi:hypothetical protein
MANYIFKNVLAALRRDWQGVGESDKSGNKDPSLKVSAGLQVKEGLGGSRFLTLSGKYLVSSDEKYSGWALEEPQ